MLEQTRGEGRECRRVISRRARGDVRKFVRILSVYVGMVWGREDLGGAICKGMAIFSRCRDWTEMDNKTWSGNFPAGDAFFCERNTDHAEL